MEARRAPTCRGAALPLAVLILAIMAAAAAGALFMTVQEQRLAGNVLRVEQALAAAEAGVLRATDAWDPRLVDLARGAEFVFAGGLESGGGWYRGAVRRLGDSLYLVRSEGFSPDSAARREVGLLVRLRNTDGTWGAAPLAARSWSILY